MNVIIRPEKIKDIDGIKTVNDAAFGQNNEADMVNALRKNPEFKYKSVFRFINQ